METAGSRREFLTVAATGVGAGWLTTAGAQPSAGTAVVPPPPLPVWSGEYWAQKGPVKLYRRLPNADRQLVILAGAAHSLGFDRNRHRLWHVIRAFLAMPPRLDSAENGGKP